MQCAFLTPSADMFSKLNWLSFYERVKYRKSTLVFKCVNRMTPRYMTNLFKPLTHIRETRQSTRMALTIPVAKKNCYTTSFAVSGASVLASDTLQRYCNVISENCNVSFNLK